MLQSLLDQLKHLRGTFCINVDLKREKRKTIHSDSLINWERFNQYTDRQVSSNWTSANSPAMSNCRFQGQATWVFDTTTVIQYGKDPQSKGLERQEACKATKNCSGASKTLGS